MPLHPNPHSSRPLHLTFFGHMTGEGASEIIPMGKGRFLITNPKRLELSRNYARVSGVFETPSRNSPQIEGIESLSTARRQLVVNVGEKRVFEATGGRTNDSVDAIMGRRLDTVFPTPLENHRFQVSGVLILWDNRLSQPILNVLAIVGGCWPKAQKIPELLAIPLAATSL